MFEDAPRFALAHAARPALGRFVLTALALFTLQPQLRAAPPDPDLVRLLPPNAAAAGNIDLAGLRGSSIFQNFAPMMQPGPPEAGAEEASSQGDVMKEKAMTVFQTLESMVSGSYYSNPENPDEREDLFVLKGRFGATEVDQFLEGASATELEHRGVTIYNLPRELDEGGQDGQAEEPAEPEPPVSLAFLSETVAVAGAEVRVREAIGRYQDKAPAANQELLALGDPVAGSYHLWHIIDAKPLKAMAPPSDGGGEPAMGPAAMMAGFLDEMNQVRIGLQLDEGLGLRLEGLFASEEKAKLASQAFGGLLAMAQLGGPEGGEGPVPPEALELLKSVELVSSERSAGLAVKVTGEQIGNLMFAFMAGMAGGADGEAGGDVAPSQEQ